MLENDIQKIKFLVDLEGSRKEFYIVDPDEIDPTNGFISWDAPLARALVGRGVGEVVRPVLPNGKKLRMKILQIDWWA